MDISIHYVKNGCSKGSAARTVAGRQLISNFTVQLEGMGIVVDFSEHAEVGEELFAVQNHARPLIQQEYLRLCRQNNDTFLHNQCLKSEIELRVDSASRNLLCLCVDGRKDGDLYGRIYTVYAESPIPFYDTSTLLLQMERIYNAINYPQAAMCHRTFQKRQLPRTQNTNAKGRNGASQLQSKDSIGEKDTFVVQVAFRQNATWQGSVTWLGTNEKARFNSALELVWLIDRVTNRVTVACG